MQRLAEQQRQFAAALLDPALPVPPGIVGPDGRTSVRRFAVYRNNVIAGLVDILKESYPAVCRIVGEEFFVAMARIFVAQEPPSSPILLHYGAGFPGFVSAFEPAATVPYLGDVARIERAWLEAYHAAEAAPIDPAALASIPSGQLPFVRLYLHPSLRLVRSQFPALTIWQMNIKGATLEPLDLDAPEDALIGRPFAEVEIRFLPPGSAAFIRAIAKGASVLDATTFAIAADERFELERSLSGLVETQSVVGFRVSGESARQVVMVQA